MSSTINQGTDKVSKRLRLLLTIVLLGFFAGGCFAGVLAYRGISEAQQSRSYSYVQN